MPTPNQILKHPHYRLIQGLDFCLTKSEVGPFHCKLDFAEFTAKGTYYSFEYVLTVSFSNKHSSKKCSYPPASMLTSKSGHSGIAHIAQETIALLLFVRQRVDSLLQIHL